MKELKILAIFVFLLTLFSFVAAAEDCPINVIYIVDDSADACNNRAETISILEDMGYAVTTVTNNDLPSLNWDDYDIIIIGNGYLSNYNLIPLYDKPTIVMNFQYHLVDWNLIQSNIPVGVSGSSQRLKMDVHEDEHYITEGYNGTIVYTYDSASGWQGTLYVRHFKRAASTADLKVLASYYGYSSNIIISAFERGSNLKNC